jgi:hypothetical protein
MSAACSPYALTQSTLVPAPLLRGPAARLSACLSTALTDGPPSVPPVRRQERAGQDSGAVEASSRFGRAAPRTRLTGRCRRPLPSTGYLFFGDVPSQWTLVGAAMVAGSALFLLARERKIKETS